MSLKFWNHFTIFDHPVCSNPNKVDHQIYYFMKGHHYILQDQLLFLSGHLSQKNLRVLSMVTRMYIFLMLHPI